MPAIYQPARIEISIPKASFDGLYWGRYPNGDRPSGLAVQAQIAAAVHGALSSTATSLAAAAAAGVFATANLTTSGGSGVHPFKWHPGTYAASNTTITAGTNNAGTQVDLLSQWTGELNRCLLNADHIVGMRYNYRWHGLDAGQLVLTASAGGATSATVQSQTLGRGHPLGTPSAPAPYVAAFCTNNTPTGTVIAYRDATLVNGTTLQWSGALPAGNITCVHLYNFNLLTQLLNYMGTQYDVPKYMMLMLTGFTFAGGTIGNDYQTIPHYILLDPTTYGAGPDGKGGWFGSMDPKIGFYTATLYTAPVAAMFGKCGAALGWKFNSHPLFEMLIDAEDSSVVEAANAGRNWPNSSNDSRYSDAVYVTQMKNYLPQWRAAFPNTCLASQNTFLGTSTPCQEFEQWMITGGYNILPSAADIRGLSSIQDPNGPVFPAPCSSVGGQAYRGYTANGSTYKGIDYSLGDFTHFIGDIESPDYTFTVSDLFAACETGYQCSHAAFTCIPATWSVTTATLSQLRLSHTAYPKSFPQ